MLYYIILYSYRVIPLGRRLRAQSSTPPGEPAASPIKHHMYIYIYIYIYILTFISTCCNYMKHTVFKHVSWKARSSWIFIMSNIILSSTYPEQHCNSKHSFWNVHYLHYCFVWNKSYLTPPLITQPAYAPLAPASRGRSELPPSCARVKYSTV